MDVQVCSGLAAPALYQGRSRGSKTRFSMSAGPRSPPMPL